MERIRVRETAAARRYCIAGCEGYVESRGEGGRLRVVVFDPFDLMPCGPFDLSEEDVEAR